MYFLYHLSPLATVHGILFIQLTCLTVLTYNLFPGPLWSSPWSWILNFILRAFLHPIIIIFSQHMLIPTQPLLLPLVITGRESVGRLGGAGEVESKQSATVLQRSGSARRRPTESSAQALQTVGDIKRHRTQLQGTRRCRHNSSFTIVNLLWVAR